MPFGGTVQLQDFCDVVQGGRLGLSGNDFVDDGYPAFGAGGINGNVAVPEFHRPAVVLSSIGARCGKCFYADGQWTSLANTQVILPDLNRADCKYLWFQLNDERRWHRSGTAQPFIKPADVKSHRVFLPQLPEQRRIAEVLDRADALRTKRRAALAQLDTLTQSIFLDMFGDPEANGWRMTTVAGVADSARGSIRTGPFGSQLLHGEFVDQGIAVLGIDNAVRNAFRWDERRFITEDKYRQLKRYTVRPGDVLITIMGTCGRCAIVPDDIPVAINTKHLCCVTLDRRICLPVFLHSYFLRHPLARRYLERTAKGAIMAGLNMEIIKAMPIPLPPVELQKEFASRVEAVGPIRAAYQASLAKFDALFASLQHRAFRGEPI